MEQFATENLLLIEFLVDRVNFEYQIRQDLEQMQGDICVSFQFLDNVPILICEEDFMPYKPVNEGKRPIKNGKSCLFSLTPEQAEGALEQFDVYVQVYKRIKSGVPEKVLVGESLISISNLFGELMQAVTSGQTTSAKSLRDCFNLNSTLGDLVGSISVYIRMSCYGKLIVTQFQMNLEDKSVEFKAKEAHYLFKSSKKSRKLPPCRINSCSYGRNGPSVCQSSGPPPCPKPNPCASFEPPLSTYKHPPCGSACTSTPFPSYSSPPPPTGTLPSPSMNNNFPNPTPLTCPPPPPCSPACCSLQPCLPKCPKPTPCNSYVSSPSLPNPPTSSRPPGVSSGGRQPNIPIPNPCVPCCPRCTCPYPPFLAPPSPRAVCECSIAQMLNKSLRKENTRDSYGEIQAQMGFNGQMDVCTHDPNANPSQPLCYPKCGSTPQKIAMRPGCKNTGSPFTFQMSGAKENNVCVNAPTYRTRDGTKFTEISDPDKELFVLRVGKKCQDVTKKHNVDLILSTPTPLPPCIEPIMDTKRIQYEGGDLTNDYLENYYGKDKFNQIREMMGRCREGNANGKEAVKEEQQKGKGKKKSKDKGKKKKK